MLLQLCGGPGSPERGGRTYTSYCEVQGNLTQKLSLTSSQRAKEVGRSKASSPEEFTSSATTIEPCSNSTRRDQRAKAAVVFVPLWSKAVCIRAELSGFDHLTRIDLKTKSRSRAATGWIRTPLRRRRGAVSTMPSGRMLECPGSSG